jgi:hypothetical protein
MASTDTNTAKRVLADVNIANEGPAKKVKKAPKVKQIAKKELKEKVKYASKNEIS